MFRRHFVIIMIKLFSSDSPYLKDVTKCLLISDITYSVCKLISAVNTPWGKYEILFKDKSLRKKEGFIITAFADFRNAAKAQNL